MTKNELSNIYHLDHVRGSLNEQMAEKKDYILRELQTIQMRCKASFHIDFGIFSNDYFSITVYFLNAFLRNKNNELLFQKWTFESGNTQGAIEFQLADIRETIEAAEALQSELENKLDN